MSSKSGYDAREEGEGGPEGPKGDLRRVLPAAARNSSGSASVASSLLDLRVKLNLAYELIEELFTALGDADGAAHVKKIRQQGFRVDRRPNP